MEGEAARIPFISEVRRSVACAMVEKLGPRGGVDFDLLVFLLVFRKISFEKLFIFNILFI
jgi:hypothetical protein